MSDLYLSEEERRVSRASIARAIAEERIRDGQSDKPARPSRRLAEEELRLAKERQATK